MSEVAFDYDRQVWVNGQEAKTIRRAQLEEDMRVLRSPSAIAYAKFLNRDLDEMIAHAEEELRALNGGAS